VVTVDEPWGREGLETIKTPVRLQLYNSSVDGERRGSSREIKQVPKHPASELEGRLFSRGSLKASSHRALVYEMARVGGSGRLLGAYLSKPSEGSELRRPFP